MSQQFRIKPTGDYNGLTVIMANPSRFDLDNHRLLSGQAGVMFNEEMLKPNGTSRSHIDIRVRSDETPLLPGTKVVMLLGKEAMTQYLPERYKDNTLGEMRGSPIVHNDIIWIPSFLPQDCRDLKDYEHSHNSMLQEDEGESDDEGGDEYSNAKSRHGRTRRSNYRFWLLHDTAKATRLLADPKLIQTDKTEYVIYPASTDIIHLLTTTKNEYLYFDIETDINLNILCFAFGFGIKRIFVVPLIRHDYEGAYSSRGNILRAFAIGLRDNISVAFNGAGFDWFVWAWRYRIPWGQRMYDPMIAHHRCYPEVEKSLGHAVSLWTYETFHKDEGIFMPQSGELYNRLLRYCGKDVSSMILVREAIEAHAKTKPGVEDSIAQGNDSIDYNLTMMMTGLHYRQQELDAIVKENDRCMMQYIRFASELMGEHNFKALRGKNKGHILSSSQQAAEYFHEMLGYPVISRSLKTGKPSLGAKQIYKMKLKHQDNPMLDLILAYREKAKLTGTLGFMPMWQELGVMPKQEQQPELL